MVMQAWFLADETQPGRGESLIRKQFKLTTSACASLKRREHWGGAHPRDQLRHLSRGYAAAEPYPSDVASVAAQQCLAPARNSGPCAGEAACGSSDSQPRLLQHHEAARSP